MNKTPQKEKSILQKRAVLLGWSKIIVKKYEIHNLILFNKFINFAVIWLEMI